MKIKSQHGPDTEVTHVMIKSRQFLQIVRLTAVCGQSKSERTVTFGAVDGPRTVPPSIATLQKRMDEHRQLAADDAAWLELTRLAMKRIQ